MTGVRDFSPMASQTSCGISIASLPTILEELEAPRVKVYPPETIVAEKLHAMVSLGIANSRMKDFFDVFILASLREFDEELLATAVQRTFARRHTIIPVEAFPVIGEYLRAFSGLH